MRLTDTSRTRRLDRNMPCHRKNIQGHRKKMDIRIRILIIGLLFAGAFILNSL